MTQSDKPAQAWAPPKSIIIWVRKRKIMRRGQKVDGWQAGFQIRHGGATSIDREEAVGDMIEIAKRHLPGARIEVRDE